MTTTAEKIKIMQAFEGGAQIQAQQSSAITKVRPWLDIEEPDWNWTSCNYRIKPPEPKKPLECWVNFYGKKEEQTHPPCAQLVHLVEDRAHIARMKGGKTIHMREVTPQMKQDKLDAKRYHKLKDLHCATAPDWIYTPWQWDEMIDKAMED